jgi:GAF domain-containing protein
VAYDVEERLRTKSGEYRWFRARGQAIWDEAGQPVRMVGSTTDITERKLAEAERERLVSALESRSKQLWTAAEVSRAASSILDVNELIQQVVDLVQERFGLYYAGLFLVDETGEWSGEAGKWAVLRAGTGEAGRHMRQAGHKLEVGGQSMIGWCIANQQARIALDVGEEAVRFENPWLPETRSEMALPLIARGWAIGAMTIQSSREAAFSAEDTAMLQTMADQVANAVENARLFEQAQARAEEQAILYRITETVSRSLDMHELLEATLDIVLTALKFDAGLVSLSDEESGKLYLAVQNGLPASMARHLEQKGLANTLCDVVFQTGETLSISDVRLGAPVDVSGVIKQGLYTYAGTPLVYGDKKVGTICFFNRSVRELTAQERSLLEAIGRQIGVGVENTRLFEETRSALAEVEATHRIYLQREWREYLDRRDNLVYEGGLAGALTKDQPAASAGNGGHGAKAELAVPIVLRGQTIGVLGLEDPQGTRQWSAQDQALVEAVSRQLALALENARLLEETQRRAARERLAREITDKMRHASTMDALIQTTVREMAAALGAPNAFLQLSTPPESDR